MLTVIAPDRQAAYPTCLDLCYMHVLEVDAMGDRPYWMVSLIGELRI